MRRIFFVVTSVLLAASVYGQAVSAKKDVAVFRLSYYSFNVPPNALGRVDARIQDVFVNLGRFNVIGMDYRLSEDNISEFIDKLKSFKQAHAKIPEGVHLGHEAFTEADLSRLAGSFIIVIPDLTSYSLHYELSIGFTAELETSFTFINVDQMTAFAHFTVRTIGTGSYPNEAIAGAADQLTGQLQYDIRTVPEFQLKTGIVDVEGNTVLIQLGADMGVKPGDEFAIVTPSVLPSGYVVTHETGLIIVKEVQKEVSYARVIYARVKPHVGDQLKELPRFGFESTFYAHGIFGGTLSGPGSSIPPIVALGTFAAVTRGFYNFRPLIGVEVPVLPNDYVATATYGYGGIPINFYIGGELNWRVWRFDIVPLIGLGFGGLIPLHSGDRFYLSQAGGLIQIGLEFLVTPQVKVFLDGGVTQWLPLSTSYSGYGGFYGGAGISVGY